MMMMITMTGRVKQESDDNNDKKSQTRDDDDDNNDRKGQTREWW